jgi:general stress protein 26
LAAVWTDVELEAGTVPEIHGSVSVRGHEEKAELVTAGRRIVDEARYVVLGTADAAGQPWASPVFFAADRYAAFYWISSPDVTHSRNIAVRPAVSLVVFDSGATPGEGAAVYMSATAAQVVDEDEVRQGLTVYPGPAARGGWPFTVEKLQAPAQYRLYRATVVEHSMLCPRESGPCAEHGLAYDHRTAVVL